MGLLQNAENSRRRQERQREISEQRLLQESPLSLQELECFLAPFVTIIENTLSTIGMQEGYQLHRQLSTMLVFEDRFYKPAEATLAQYSLTETQVLPSTQQVQSTVYGSRFTISKVQPEGMVSHPLVISAYSTRSDSTHFSQVQVMINVRNLTRSITLPDVVDKRKIETTVSNAVYDWAAGTFGTSRPR